MKPLVLARYALFLLLACLLAVQCAVAVWDLTAGLSEPIDIFLIFTGASGILLIFVLLLVDAARERAIFSAVWFELCWIALYLLFEIAGSSVLTDRQPDALCSTDDAISTGCASTTALVAISWTLMAVFAAYFLLLWASALIHHPRNGAVWTSGVRDFAWFSNWGLRERIRSAPCSPIKGLFGRQQAASAQPAPTNLVQPKPRLARQPPTWASADALRATYDIEHYAVENLNEYAAQEEHTPVAPPPVHQMRAMRPAMPPSLYSQHVQATLPPPLPLQTVVTRTTSHDSSSLEPIRTSRVTPRNYQLPPPSRRPDMSESTSPPSTSPRPKQSRKPSGPRSRPPPLDLSGVSVYRQQ